ncbi:MAG: pyridoxal phosphate-dependent aminotransferase [Phycisphaerae bacterium]|nr:pyridoxal phosphate-dependent aminotransferase [Phycisphaerae bacterium]
MQLSARVSALRPSTTLAVNAKAKALQAQGVSVLSFAAGEPDFDTPARIKQALIDALNRGETKYCAVPGDMATRKVIAEKLTRENALPNVTADHVVISSGGKQSLYQVFQALLEPGAEVILPTPAWVSYPPQIELAGGKVVEVVTTAASGFKMTPGQLRGAVTPRSRALVINSPSNPCGTMYAPDELRAIARVVADIPDLVVISDELYEKIVFGGIPHFSIGSVPEIAERVVTVNGLSKAYAMTGWRIGYCSGSGAFGLQLSKALQTLQSQSTTSIATFELPAVRVALTECADDVERMRQAFARRAEITYSLVSKIPGLVCPRPTGAFYIFPDVSAHFGKVSANGTVIASAADFAAALLDEQRVAVVPGEDFGSGGEKCVRFTFACGDEQIKEGLSRLGAFVASLH